MAAFGIGPNLANYGSRGRSPSLVSFGENQQDTATQGLGAAATEETQRNASNTMRAAQAKAGNEQLGGTIGSLAGTALGSVLGGGAAAAGGAAAGGAAAAAGGAAAAAAGGAASGAETGSVIGPWGTLIGGVLGAIAGGLFSR